MHLVVLFILEDTYMSFEENIKEWVQLDNELKLYNERARTIRDRKAELLDKILGENREFDKNLNNRTIDISDGKLKFQNSKQTSPLTFKYLQDSLHKIIRNEKQVEQIVNYLKENREIKLVPEIKRSS
jgi:hypothetical protein|tara:strand:- start:281 stop:664 length:384 start_codon:yes stop_codon:yes gene_type:complete